MRVIRALMGMPVAVELIDGTDADIERIFGYFADIDARFSTYKHTSEISQLNRGDISLEHASSDMLEVLALAEQAKLETDGIIDVRTPAGTLDPSGIVKGWAIRNAGRLAEKLGYHDYWIEAGCDIQVAGHDEDNRLWRVGVRHPFTPDAIAQALTLTNCGIATSGTYARGEHIYDPRTGKPALSPYVSLTVLGPDVYQADLWATAAFIMGEAGLDILAARDGFEAYAIGHDGIATMTPGWLALTGNAIESRI